MPQTRRISLGFLLLGLMVVLCSPATAGVVLFSDLSAADLTHVPPGIYFGPPFSGGVAELFPVSGAGNFSVTQIDAVFGGSSVGIAPNFNLAIWTDSGNTLGTLLESWILSPPATAYCCTQISIPGITGLTLVGGQSYFIAFTPAADISGLPGWDNNQVGVTTATILVSPDLGATWTNGGACPCIMGAFDVIGVATPEPGTIGTLGAGLLALGLLRKRLR